MFRQQVPWLRGGYFLLMGKYLLNGHRVFDFDNLHDYVIAFLNRAKCPLRENLSKGLSVRGWNSEACFYLAGVRSGEITADIYCKI